MGVRVAVALAAGGDADLRDVGHVGGVAVGVIYAFGVHDNDVILVGFHAAFVNHLQAVHLVGETGKEGAGACGCGADGLHADNVVGSVLHDIGRNRHARAHAGGVENRHAGHVDVGSVGVHANTCVFVDFLLDFGRQEQVGAGASDLGEQGRGLEVHAFAGDGKFVEGSGSVGQHVVADGGGDNGLCGAVGVLLDDLLLHVAGELLCALVNHFLVEVFDVDEGVPQVNFCGGVEVVHPCGHFYLVSLVRNGHKAAARGTCVRKIAVYGHAVFTAAQFAFLEKVVGVLDVVKILFDCVCEQDKFLAVAESTSHSFKPRFVSECYSLSPRPYGKNRGFEIFVGLL